MVGPNGFVCAVCSCITGDGHTALDYTDVQPQKFIYDPEHIDFKTVRGELGLPRKIGAVTIFAIRNDARVDPGLVEIVRWKTGPAEFGRKRMAERFETAAGQDQQRAGSCNALQMFAVSVTGQLGRLEDTCRAVCKPQHDRAATAEFLTCPICVQIGSIHLPK